MTCIILKFYKHCFIFTEGVSPLKLSVKKFCSRTITSGSRGLTAHPMMCQGDVRKARAENHLFYLVVETPRKRHANARGPGFTEEDSASFLPNLIGAGPVMQRLDYSMGQTQTICTAQGRKTSLYLAVVLTKIK